jgi:hypothetical protein
MHIDGAGPVDKLAGAVRKAIDEVHRIREASPARSFGGDGDPGEERHYAWADRAGLRNQGTDRPQAGCTRS